MGVDFYTCKHCGETFSDHDEGYTFCKTCYSDWCSEECAKKDGYIKAHCNIHPSLNSISEMDEYREEYCYDDSCEECKHYVPDTCNYCRKEDFDDDVLLEYCMELLNITREELVQAYKNKMSMAKNV